MNDELYSEKIKKHEAIINDSNVKIAKAKAEIENLKERHQKDLLKRITTTGISLEELLMLAECLKANNISVQAVIELISDDVKIETTENEEKND